MSVLSKPYFHDEAAAFAFVEGIIWNGAPHCPTCGSLKIYAIKPNVEKKVRMGLKKCGDCKRQFTVRIGTIFEESHLPLHKWLQAIYLMCSSKKGISSKQLERTLECTYKTAWFLSHRIREAMRSGELDTFGGNGTAVEVDETFIGREPGSTVKAAYHHKMKVLTLVDRETGRARSTVIDNLRPETIAPIVNANLAREAILMTDEAHHYKKMGLEFAAHETVQHKADEYVRYGSPMVTTNTVENYFSVFKRGMKGTYQHCAKKHLHRYLAEFDFRYSNRSARGCEDVERAERALQGILGKRLTYKTAGCRA